MLGYFLLIFSTFIWGISFVAVKWILPFFSAQQLHHVRLFIAGGVSLIYFSTWWLLNQFRKKETITYRLLFKKSFWWPPLLCGFILYLFLALQTEGIAFTTVAKSGFITCLYVLFIPIFLFLGWKKKFSFIFWVYCCLSLLGIYLLMDAKFENINHGDVLTLLCAMVGAIHILAVDKLAYHYRPIIFNCLQCIVMAMLATLAVTWNGEWVVIASGLKQMDHMAILGFIMIGFFSSFLAFAFQIYAQKMIAPHIVAVLFLLESPFAAISAVFFLGESLSLQGIIGCGLVLLSAYQVSRMSGEGQEVAG
ncbi:MAG: DMT family transporter [Bacteriovoracaceae bacterium]|nr:DMT family transporter [Bacteriovoracaceae bacterium]